MTTQINRRWVVGYCDSGVYLTYHDRPLSQDEREFDGNWRDHLSDKALDRAMHEKIVFTQSDQSYPALAACLA